MATQSVWAAVDMHSLHHDSTLDTVHHASLSLDQAVSDDSNEPQTDHHHSHHHGEPQFMSDHWLLPEWQAAGQLKALYKKPRLQHYSSHLFRPPRY
ncbi:MAG: hypothetical protein CSA54_02765 [Gammaproteobacteria bacterium]|nr:MAG: hypothetical protein CSA54_02765 [Gammaproteobacteria bacterium]